MEQSYSLVEKPWINVEMLDGTNKSVNLIDLFEHASAIKQIHGDNRAQDFAIFRLALAVLSTATYDPNLKDQDEILKYWQSLYEHKDVSKAITYLKNNSDKFDFLGEHPFMQVNVRDYNTLVEPKKEITDKSIANAVKNGSLITPLSTINRNVAQSGSKISAIAYPSIIHRNELSMPELVRWIITYQGYSGATDKTKLKDPATGKKAKYSTNSGYLLNLAPVFIKGKNLADTLLLNLVMLTKDLHYTKPRPIWDRNLTNEVNKFLNPEQPDNLAEFCTYPSRMIHIDYSTGQPLVFMAGLPAFELNNLFTDPFTSYHWSTGLKAYRPNLLSKSHMNDAMWRDFGNYINTTTDDNHIPGIVEWIRILQDADILPFNYKLNLARIIAIKDGNAASQLPIHVVSDDMTINTELTKDDEWLIWGPAIEDAINKAQEIGKRGTYSFGKAFKPDQSSLLSEQYFTRLNKSFQDWLNSLSIDQDPDEKVSEWAEFCGKTAKDVINNYIKYNLTADEIRLIIRKQNIVFGIINKIVKGEA